MIKITLNASERVLAMHIACGREENNKRKNFNERKQCDRSGWDINFEGVCGEIAACKYLKVYPDTEYSVDNPPKHDLITKLGFTVDVKTADASKDFWSATIWKKPEDVDKYLFVRGRFPTYEICGWARSDEYIHPSKLHDVGNGKFYKISMDEISNMQGEF